MNRLRLIFAGTPEFAIPSLTSLLQHHDICAVYTKPDSPSGRGLKLQPSPVKQYVVEHHPTLPILQPTTLKDPDTQQQLEAYHADAMIVIAYGLIIPEAVFSRFKYGCINVHASLLPRWRGAAPIQRAILAGDSQTGVTIMQIDKGLDTGAMLSRQPYHLKETDTARTVHDALAAIGSEALVTTLDDLVQGRVQPIAQDHEFATYAAKISKEEAQINWHSSAVQIDRHIRAFNPWPIARTYLHNEIIKVWEAVIGNHTRAVGIPGQVIAVNDEGIEVGTGDGTILIKRLQLPGGKVISVKDFINAKREYIIPNKTVFGNDANNT